MICAHALKTTTMSGTEDPKQAQSFGTDCVHAGFEFDPQTGAVMPTISLSTTFKQNYPGVPLSVKMIMGVLQAKLVGV